MSFANSKSKQYRPAQDPKPQRTESPARLLYKHAFLDSIANVESTVQLYDILISDFEAQLASGCRDPKMIKFDLAQFRAYRSKIAIRRDALLAELKGVPVSQPGLVNRMMETAFSGSQEQIQGAYEHYWKKIRETQGQLKPEGSSMGEKVSIKVLYDCQNVLREQYLALRSA